MTADEAVDEACRRSTLLDALSWIAVWESERIVEQAVAFYRTGKRTGSNGAAWDTCFHHLFQRVMERYGDQTAGTEDST